MLVPSRVFLSSITPSMRLSLYILSVVPKETVLFICTTIAFFCKSYPEPKSVFPCNMIDQQSPTKQRIRNERTSPSDSDPVSEYLSGCYWRME
jgi:hypothetical protein